MKIHEAVAGTIVVLDYDPESDGLMVPPDKIFIIHSILAKGDGDIKATLVPVCTTAIGGTISISRLTTAESIGI